jgi:lipoyl(octanoyl) transferase
MQVVNYFDLHKVDFKECWDLQEAILAETVNQKTQNRTLAPENHFAARHFLLFCEHPHVFTLGKSGDETHLLANQEQLNEQGATFYKINRGGDITYHGPGQLVGYPIFDLDFFFNDIHKYLRFLEEAVILTCKDYGLVADRIPGLTGVWLDVDNKDNSRKICAFGVRCSRWVTMHGFAFNVNTDLNFFNEIVPCGITDRGVTSLKMELGRELDLEEVKGKMLKHLSELFNFNVANGDLQSLPWKQVQQATNHD